MFKYRNVILSLVLSCSASLCLAADPGLLPPGGYNVQFQTGLPSPFPPQLNFNATLTEQGTGALFTVPARWTPIIPQGKFSLLLDRVARNGHLQLLSSSLTSFADSLREYAFNGGVNCAVGPHNIDIPEGANLSLAIAQNWVVRSTTMRNPPGVRAMATYFNWLPGNYYIAPTHRADRSTDSQIDTTAQPVIGRERWDSLSRINIFIDMYLVDNNPLRVTDINSLLVTLSRIVTAAPLNPSIWQNTGDGYRVRQGTPIPANIDPDLAVPAPAVNSQLCRGLRPTFAQMRRMYTTTLIR